MMKNVDYLFIAHNLRRLISWQAKKEGLATYNVNMLAKRLGVPAKTIYDMVGSLNGPGFMGFHDKVNPKGAKPRPLNKPSIPFLLNVAKTLDWNPLFIMGLVSEDSAYLSDLPTKSRLKEKEAEIKRLREKLESLIK